MCTEAPDVIDELLHSIILRRFVVLCGAGLSMAPPSTVPSARSLAEACAAEYGRTFGSALPPAIQSDLSALAEHFAQQSRLHTIFISRLLQRQLTPFLRNPNPGHYALADFLACRAAEFTLSTNVDVLLERAAEALNEPAPFAATSREEAVRPLDHNPHIKLHGCIQRDRSNTLWCPSQLQTDPFQTRLHEFAEWLPGQVSNKDLLIVGFWSDWSYLNHALASAVNAVEPGLVVVVDPADWAALLEKAPMLTAWAQGDRVRLRHIRESGAEFVSRLRKRYSLWFLEQVVRTAHADLSAEQTGRYIGPFDTLPCEELYEWRQNALGMPSNQVIRERRPGQTCELFARTLSWLLENGGQLRGARIEIGGRRARLVSGAGQLLSSVRKRFDDEPVPQFQDDVVVCAGARDDGDVPSDIVRSGGLASFVRPASTAPWITDESLPETLGGPTNVFGARG